MAQLKLEPKERLAVYKSRAKVRHWKKKMGLEDDEVNFSVLLSWKIIGVIMRERDGTKLDILILALRLAEDHLKMSEKCYKE
jgi:hypothetical protein